MVGDVDGDLNGGGKGRCQGAAKAEERGTRLDGKRERERASPLCFLSCAALEGVSTSRFSGTCTASVSDNTSDGRENPCAARSLLKTDAKNTRRRRPISARLHGSPRRPAPSSPSLTVSFASECGTTKQSRTSTRPVSGDATPRSVPTTRPAPSGRRVYASAAASRTNGETRTEARVGVGGPAEGGGGGRGRHRGAGRGGADGNKGVRAQRARARSETDAAPLFLFFCPHPCSAPNTRGHCCNRPTWCGRRFSK